MLDTDRQGLLPIYADAFKQAQLDPSLPMYVACGIFQSQPLFAQEWRHSFASKNVNKEQLLEPSELSALHSEQRAAVDFLVLVHAEKFVGVQISSFSFWAVEHRKLHGIAAAADFLIQLRDTPFPNDMFVATNTCV